MNLFQSQSNEFLARHIGTLSTTNELLAATGSSTLEELIGKTVPANIRKSGALSVPDAVSEAQLLKELKEISLQNKVFRSFIGQGYYDTLTPSVILRNIFENPGWYTQYTPYQAEISQGRLESLLNYQTMVSDLTGLPLANASLLDEATAAAEAMNMFFHQVNKTDLISQPRFFVDNDVFTQTKDLLITRATPIGIEVVFGDYRTAVIDNTYFGALVQYPNDKGSIEDYRTFINSIHAVGGYIAMATDLLALTLLTSPGELGADVALGSAQRFGVPLGYGGPHAAFFSAKDEFKRALPGRIIGVSVDASNNRALRMALQTREQHIKREKATSNICTAQALLANMAAMYAVYHGPDGLKAIAKRVTLLTRSLAAELSSLGFTILNNSYFDTLTIEVKDAEELRTHALANQMNFHYKGGNIVGISLDETTTQSDILDIIGVFAASIGQFTAVVNINHEASLENIPTALTRTSEFMTHPVFNSHRSESQMMRYIKSLENKDLSLNTSMISLGSCTMKLNAATEMMPLSWSHFSRIHPFVPVDQAAGYQKIIKDLSDFLCNITGFDACSMQPNSGAQGEYAGLLTIRNFHLANGDAHRNVILIPISAHGTNPASAVMAGMKVVVVKALENGYIDVADFRAKAEQYSANLAGTMITYPSTYGIFEESVKEICEIVHQHGGQVYMDGANMNAQVGLTSPGLIGADVCHLNLHKTFAIPHGGGGPGMGPICVKSHLAPHLPGHWITRGDKVSNGAVSAAPYGSASILLISYAYCRMLGAEGLKKATEYAILNANYMKARLEQSFPILYTGHNGTCAHEFIVDLRPFKTSAGVEAEDVAKRLMDYGFHAPTLSFPVPGTIMIEPTESEDKAELDRFCDALLSIRKEIAAIENGQADKSNNILKHAPHTQFVVTADEWTRPYSRQQAAYPLEYVKANKFWPSISRVNNTVGDRNLICTCEPVSSYAEE
ncbi:aminomethyl-transferring glycine dehydrogenase [Flavihumibacter stibioxidans]|uniref:Glycine dehydrogenase (decarboxylating) n=1 Tax=Flavihumibacter stibioxidans TaxID=1834163 RepID=A0ABR7MDG6_9BACT|nr:aminomethyl-transferring glycine dehydrogenase [Flavihumibacter stibioxidans]MBC6493077.1 glycine dehydrogenase (aminomethyl-transferring) [Flavihumibacter stibioxidans]